MIKTIITGAITGAMALAAMVAIPQAASANVIEFDAQNANNRGSCSHGLWTGSIGTGCSRRYSLQDDAVFTIDEHSQTATFTGSAINNKGQVAQIDLTFGDFLESTLGTNFGFKNGGGVNFNPQTDTPDIDFFTSGSGSIILDGRRFTLNANDPFAGNTALQVGLGANDKTADFGASAWLNFLDPYGNPLGQHWDINLNLTPRPGTPVPAPAGLGLMAMGLAGLGFGLRRRKRVAA